MKVSIVTGIPWVEGRTHAQVYRETIEQVKYAEELGFDCVWFTEHHFATHGINPSILPLMAYIAGITKRIRIGTAVVVLPLYHPLRLAEDIATVDIVSEGRLELGIGSGYRLDEFKGFAIPAEESRGMFLETLEVLFKAWSGEPFSYEGRYYQVPEGTSVRPIPLQKPHPPIWVAAISPKSLEWIAQRGYRWMGATTGAPFPELCHMREHFDQALVRAGRHPDEVEFYAHFPIYIAEKTYEGIRQDLEDILIWFARAVGGGGTIYKKAEGLERSPLVPLEGFDFHIYHENFGVFGPPDFCLHKLEEWWRKLRFTHLTCAFNIGLPHHTVMKNMEQFARYLMPSLRDIDLRAVSEK